MTRLLSGCGQSDWSSICGAYSRDILTCSDAKEVSEEEYREFYKAIAKEPMGETLGWSHFKASFHQIAIDNC